MNSINIITKLFFYKLYYCLKLIILDHTLLYTMVPDHTLLYTTEPIHVSKSVCVSYLKKTCRGSHKKKNLFLTAILSKIKDQKSFHIYITYIYENEKIEKETIHYCIHKRMAQFCFFVKKSISAPTLLCTMYTIFNALLYTLYTRTYGFTIKKEAAYGQF